MRPVNLIPPEDRRGDHAPLRAGAASYAIVGVLAVALVGVVMIILTGNKITESKSDIAGLEVRKAQADVAAADLAPYGQFATLEQSRSETVGSLAQSRFDWERVLNELALVIPQRVTLENLTGSASAGVSLAEGTTGAADASITGPSLLISGCAEGQKGVARLLAALKDIDGVTRVGMESSQLGDDTTGSAQATGSAQQSTGGSEGTTTCLTGPKVAQFHVTVAFDAVPAPVAATAPATTAPAAADATTTPATPTGSADVAATEAEQQSAVDSAEQQTTKAKDTAATVGVGG